jgi:hypothetical protein
VIEAKYALVQLYGNTPQLLYHGFYKNVWFYSQGVVLNLGKRLRATKDVWMKIRFCMLIFATWHSMI